MAGINEMIVSAVNAISPELDTISRNMYDNPELGYE